MTQDRARALIASYFRAFNAGDTEAMMALVSDDLAHHVNEGQIRHGRAAFAEFNAHMARCYRERLEDMTIFVSEDGARAAAEFTVHGTYLATDSGLPAARGQSYVLPAGSFFTLRDGQIARITTYYNLADWLAQVNAA
ncbi:ketosteroid isomerase-related protein [Phaeovulum sp. NW3]|uniref:ketosteroid isomerase-related protein n=1 Tax=Phaeovulum sp. NW3 TaxID=2934933 RepID=UPI00201FB8B1|nr:ketosteroid isomerase-related protein [Phaeovulum sp. NW3]MCL7466695.1 nuclear transport factor 2 family protein [Phaeovulum sp. NW3]